VTGLQPTLSEPAANLRRPGRTGPGTRPWQL